MTLEEYRQQGDFSCPCLECLLFVMCKTRINPDKGSLSQIAGSEKCNNLLNFMAEANQDNINKGRVKFGFDPIR